MADRTPTMQASGILIAHSILVEIITTIMEDPEELDNNPL